MPPRWLPWAFRPAQVTACTALLYVALITLLLSRHHRLPPAPHSPTPINGINLTQAWLDLEYICSGSHPWNSRRNEQVRDYLLERIHATLEHNEVPYKTLYALNGTFQSLQPHAADSKLVTVFANDTSNFTGCDDWTQKPWTLYGESQNILVYIRGTEDREDEWWNMTEEYSGDGGVLVNAHYDSVPTSVGATDDGIGVVTVLQLISHFASNQPRHGIVALLNNGEELGLYGARNFVRHPLSQFPRTFLNLEGAGSGGRSMLFRSTDAAVTRAYATSPHPFGSVVSGDGFKRGFVRSGTDYSIFVDELGLRGLDVAFYDPRSRYHTDQDDSRNTNRESLWHMLSASIATMTELTSRGHSSTEEPGKDAFWFDLLGSAFVVGRFDILFALSVTLLVVGPLVLIAVEFWLRRSDKWYLTTASELLQPPVDNDGVVTLHKRRGIFRTAGVIVLPTAAVAALAYLVSEANPLIIYSSEYAVWTMFMAAWFVVAWTILAGAFSIRPTALQRMFVLLGLYAGTWILLLLATIGGKGLRLGSVYLFTIYHTLVWLALIVSYLELFTLPPMRPHEDDIADRQSGTRVVNGADSDEATERTSLLRHSSQRNSQEPETSGTSRSDEQLWETSLPQWTWLLQFAILAPFTIIVLGDVALLLTSALHQTPADGNQPLTIYLLIAAFSILLLMPLAPFLHRVTYHIPAFLVLVLAGTLIYNVTAFPFSREARMKYFFVEQVNLDTGRSSVILNGLDGYLQQIVSEIPSAAGQPLHCSDDLQPRRQGLLTCSYSSTRQNSSAYETWLDLSYKSHNASATFTISGLETKECRLVFEHPVSEVRVQDGAVDPRQTVVPPGGSYEVRLVGRTFSKAHVVHVSWQGELAEGQKGRAICSWDDAARPGLMPAFHELRRFEPVWSAVTKSSDGLLEGYKDFEL